MKMASGTGSDDSSKLERPIFGLKGTGIFYGVAAAGSGVVAYLCKNIYLGVMSAALVYGSYFFLRYAHKENKKARGLEKEIEAELGIEPELKGINQQSKPGK